MSAIEKELIKNGINVIGPIDPQSVNQISAYVARTLCTKFPDLKLNYNTLFESVSRLKMYIADMANMSGACYFYKNSTIYFQKGLSLNNIKKLAIHECIHYFQEVKDAKGKLHRLGLCTYFGNRAYGNALNEASVRLMSAYATGERRDVVTYYGITLPTDSPSYYPLLCNLVKQIGFLVGFSTMFESTFYSNDAFYEKIKNAFGEGNSYNIQKNFEKILSLESKIIKINTKIQNKEMSYYGFKNSTDAIEKCKNDIQRIFLATQSTIISSFFDSRLPKLKTVQQIENYRKYLYSFSNLIGTTSNYSFFNDYYIKKMAALDAIYERRADSNVSLMEVKKSKISQFFGYLKKLITGNADEEEYNNYK